MLRPKAEMLAVTKITAEIFETDIVRLVRSHQIDSVELLSATEQPFLGTAALPSLSIPVIIVVEARLTSALTWQQGVKNRMCCDETLKNSGNIFTYNVSFLLSRDSTGEMCPSSSLSSPHTVLSAQWCAQLQRRLAICSALTGLPTLLCVSLLPYVPHLTWHRERDGILGATHSTTMMSTVTEGGKSGGDDAGAAVGSERVVQVALLLNANIPLGPQGGRKTVVLFLHTAGGDVCFASTASSPVCEVRECRKSSRPSKRERRSSSDVVKEKEKLLPLLTRLIKTHFLPKISWETVWSRPLRSDKDGDDVCGLQEQIGCSFYLEGALDARTVQSITVIVDAPLDLWHRVLSCNPSVESNDGDHMLRQLPQCVAKTVEGALSRLAAENSDFFMRRVVMIPNGVDGEETSELAEAAAASASPSAEMSWQLLSQSIADSLVHIVRTSQNRMFVAEVHRILLMHKEGEGTLLPPTDVGDNSCIATTATPCSSLPPSATATAALLRWAVESRLMERQVG